MHPRVVELPFKRAVGLVLALMLGAAGWAECAGWQVTPEARMDCCSDSGACPMHGSSEPGSRSERVVTQAQADGCCAASGDTESTPSAPALAISLSAALVASAFPTIGPVIAPPALLDAWRAHLPLVVGQVPKHVLLSVFLI